MFEKKVRLSSDILFYAALFLYYLRSAISMTTLKEIGGIPLLQRGMFYLAFALLIAKMFMQKYTASSLYKLGVVGSVVVLSYLLSGFQEIVWGFLFVLTAKDIDMDKVAKMIMVTTLMILAGTILLSEAGIIRSITSSSTSRQYLWFGGSTRIKLWGFYHHNYMGEFILIFYICYVFLRYSYFKFRDVIVGLLAFYFCFVTIKSRTSALLIVATVALVLAIKFLKYFGDKKSKPLAELGIYAMMIFSPIFSVYVSLTYDASESIYVFLNSLLTNRFSYPHSIYNQYGFSLFGQEVELISTLDAAELGVSAIVLDNAYMHMLIRFGVCFTIIFLAGWFYIARKSLQNKNYRVAIIIAIYFVCGIAEGWLFRITGNPFLILLSGCFYEKNETVFLPTEVLNRKNGRRRRSIRIKLIR